VYPKFNDESFYLAESVSFYLGSPFPALHVILANIPFAGSVVRLALVFNYSCCGSIFLQRLRQQGGWERCLFFKRILTSSANGDSVPHVAAKNTCQDTTTRGNYSTTKQCSNMQGIRGKREPAFQPSGNFASKTISKFTCNGRQIHFMDEI
jgi:hypothetical protein